jgi:RNA polymerase sigma-70 factor (ECF subfamily)
MREDNDERDAHRWARVVAGDAVAFGEVFTEHADAVYGHCVRRTADPVAAEDVTSLVFLQAWRRRAQVPADGVVPWLFGTANNLLRNHARTLRRNRALVVRLSVPETVEPDVSEEAVERLDAVRRAVQVRAQLAGLSRPLREVVELVVWDGLTYEQAATVLGVPVGTIRSRMSRSRARLTQAFADIEAVGTGSARSPEGDDWMRSPR